jgi:hypothetical protein
MQPDFIQPEDVKLRTLLRDSREAPALPPRFREGVWSRIEQEERSARREGPGWLDALAALLMRPRAALAGVAILLVAGAVLGAREGAHAARQDAQSQYLAAVAPNSLR